MWTYIGSDSSTVDMGGPVERIFTVSVEREIGFFWISLCNVLAVEEYFVVCDCSVQCLCAGLLKVERRSYNCSKRVRILQNIATENTTSSSAVAKRLRDASWLSVVSFNSTIPQVQFLPCDAMHKRGLCRHAVSVCPSVTFVDHVKTNKRIFKIVSPLGS